MKHHIANLGHALMVLARAEAAEAIMHADLRAFHAPSECYRDVSRGEARRMRLARRVAKSIAHAPVRVIMREAYKRGLNERQWQRAVGAAIVSSGYPLQLL